jgi:hypothetical protein
VLSAGMEGWMETEKGHCIYHFWARLVALAATVRCLLLRLFLGRSCHYLKYCRHVVYHAKESPPALEQTSIIRNATNSNHCQKKSFFCKDPDISQEHQRNKVFYMIHTSKSVFPSYCSKFHIWPIFIPLPEIAASFWQLRLRTPTRIFFVSYCSYVIIFKTNIAILKRYILSPYEICTVHTELVGVNIHEWRWENKWSAMDQILNLLIRVKG